MAGRRSESTGARERVDDRGAIHVEVYRLEREITCQEGLHRDDGVHQAVPGDALADAHDGCNGR